MSAPISGPPSRRQLSKKKKLVFAVITVLGVALLLELASRVVECWFPPQPVDWGLGFDPDSTVFVPSPTMPGMMVTKTAKLFAFQQQQFAVPKPPRLLRIVAVGESSVNYLDQEFRVLEDHLKAALRPDYDRVEVINAGGLSYGSQRLVLVTAEMLEHEPDAFLVYMGHNEFEEVEQLHLAAGDNRALQGAATHSAFLRLVHDRVLAVRVAALRREHNKRVLAQTRPNVARAWRHPFTKEDVAQRMQAFHDNLVRIVTACRDKGVPVVLGTVPSNLVRPYLPEEAWREYQQVSSLLEGHHYEQAAALGRRLLADIPGRHQSSDLENRIIRSLASELAIPLADVEAAVTDAEPHRIPGETLFKDHCHLNDRGNVILRETYEKLLLRVLQEERKAAEPAGGRSGSS